MMSRPKLFVLQSKVVKDDYDEFPRMLMLCVHVLVLNCSKAKKYIKKLLTLLFG